MITKQTAYDMWVSYQEIENGEKLLSDMAEQIKNQEPVNLRDGFGRRRNLQLGVPMGETGHRLLDVNPALAIEVIKAHIANKRAELAVVNERAKSEL